LKAAFAQIPSGSIEYCPFAEEASAFLTERQESGRQESPTAAKPEAGHDIETNVSDPFGAASPEVQRKDCEYVLLHPVTA